MGTDENVERNAIHSLLKAQRRWSDQNDKVEHLGESSVTGFTFGPWFPENGEAQLRVLPRHLGRVKTPLMTFAERILATPTTDHVACFNTTLTDDD